MARATFQREQGESLLIAEGERSEVVAKVNDYCKKQNYDLSDWRKTELASGVVYRAGSASIVVSF